MATKNEQDMRQKHQLKGKVEEKGQDKKQRLEKSNLRCKTKG